MHCAIRHAGLGNFVPQGQELAGKGKAAMFAINHLDVKDLFHWIDFNHTFSLNGV